MYNGKLPVRACMRVGVIEGGYAVGRPAGVTDTDISADIFTVIGFILKIFNSLGGF